MILGTLFEQTWISLFQGCSILNINTFRHWFMRRRFLKIYQNVSLFCNLLGPKEASPFIWTNMNPHLQVCFLLSLVEISLVVLEKKTFKAFPYILLCKSLSSWGGAIHDPRDFIWTNLNLIVPRMLHTKYQYIPPLVHEKKIFEDLSKFSLFCPLLGPKEVSPFIWIIWIHIPKHVFCQVWLKLA